MKIERWTVSPTTGYAQLEFDIYTMIVADEPQYTTVYTHTDEKLTPYAVIHNGLWHWVSEDYSLKRPMNIYARMLQQKLDTWHDFNEQREQNESRTLTTSIVSVVNLDSGIDIIAQADTVIIGIRQQEDDGLHTALIPLPSEQVDDLLGILQKAKSKQFEWRIQDESDNGSLKL